MIKVQLPFVDYKNDKCVLYSDVKCTMWDKLLMLELVKKNDLFENDEEFEENVNFVKENINLFDMWGEKIDNEYFDLEIDDENEFNLKLHIKPTPEQIKENKYNGGVVLILSL